MTIVEFPRQDGNIQPPPEPPEQPPEQSIHLAPIWRRATVKAVFIGSTWIRYTIAEECWWREGADMQAAVDAIKESMKIRYRIPPSGSGRHAVTWTCTVDPKSYEEAQDG